MFLQKNKVYQCAAEMSLEKIPYIAYSTKNNATNTSVNN